MLRQANLRKDSTTGTLEVHGFYGPLGISQAPVYGQNEDTALPWPIRNHAGGFEVWSNLGRLRVSNTSGRDQNA